MALVQTERRRELGPSYPGVLLSTANAARLAGVAEGEIWEQIARGGLAARAGQRPGGEVWLVPLEELRQRFEGASRRVPIEELEWKSRLARLEGELATAERVERAVQRHADRLETRISDLEGGLEEERGKTLSLARALGQAEGERERLSRLLEAAPAEEPARKGLFARLLGR